MTATIATHLADWCGGQLARNVRALRAVFGGIGEIVGLIAGAASTLAFAVVLIPALLVPHVAELAVRKIGAA